MTIGEKFEYVAVLVFFVVFVVSVTKVVL